MKYPSFLLLAFCFIAEVTSGQQTRSIRVHAGEDLAQAYSPTGFNRFPQFMKAILYFNGLPRNTGVLFNFNLLSGTLQFIGPKGDTMDLVSSPGPDSVLFDQAKFLAEDGFAEVVAQSDSLNVLKKIELNTQAESIGAYGTPNNTGAITQIRDISVRGAVYNLVVNEDIVLSEEITLLLKWGNQPPVKATKSNLLKLLPAEKKAKAEAFLKKNKVSFRDEEDLKSLFAALHG